MKGLGLRKSLRFGFLQGICGLGFFGIYSLRFGLHPIKSLRFGFPSGYI